MRGGSHVEDTRTLDGGICTPMEWLTRSIDEHTVVWVLLSSLLGGMVGGALSFLFEFILPESFRERREVLAVKRQFATPIFRSSDYVFKLNQLASFYDVPGDASSG